MEAPALSDLKDTPGNLLESEIPAGDSAAKVSAWLKDLQAMPAGKELAAREYVKAISDLYDRLSAVKKSIDVSAIAVRHGLPAQLAKQWSQATLVKLAGRQRTRTRYP